MQTFSLQSNSPRFHKRVTNNNSTKAQGSRKSVNEVQYDGMRWSFCCIGIRLKH